MIKFIGFIFVLIFISYSFLTAYDYSFDRNSQEWKNMSVEERLQAMQIPENQLKDLPTIELIDAYAKSFFPSQIFFYNNFFKGFEVVYHDFNGLRELLERKDIVQELLMYYKKMNPYLYNREGSLVEKGEYGFTFIYIEGLISYQKILTTADSTIVKNIISELIEKYNGKSENYEVFSNLGLSSTVLPIVRLILEKDSDTDCSQKLLKIDGIKYFSKMGWGISQEDFDKIIDIANDFLNTY